MAGKVSISTTFTLWLAIMVLGLIILAVLTSAGFYSFNKSLSRYNSVTMPQVVHSSHMANAVNQLLTDTERLVSSSNEPARRVAYNKVLDQLGQIKMLISRYDIVQERTKEELALLEKTLEELNGLIAADITLTEREDSGIVELLKSLETVINFDRENRNKVTDRAHARLFYEWVTLVADVVHDGGQLKTIKILYKINNEQEKLKQKFSELQSLSSQLSAQTGIDFISYVKGLENLILGSGGLIELSKQRITISLSTASRGNFARSLAEEFKSLNTTHLNIVMADAGAGAEKLKNLASQMVIVFSVISSIAVVIAVAIIFVLRKKLTGRLLALNEAIIMRIKGKPAVIDISGNDEITEMAKSFEFYAAEVQKREEALRELAMKDSLTGVNNRRNFIELSEKEILKAERYKRKAAFMMLDIDHFKRVNDTYGHGAGDEMLKVFTKLCAENLRSIDIFGRLGGEEFGAMMPESDESGAFNAAERIRERFAEMVLKVGDFEIKATVSIGISVVNGAGFSLSELMKEADEALYRAKNEGRNRVCKY